MHSLDLEGRFNYQSFKVGIIFKEPVFPVSSLERLLVQGHSWREGREKIGLLSCCLSPFSLCVSLASLVFCFLYNQILIYIVRLE